MELGSHYCTKNFSGKELLNGRDSPLNRWFLLYVEDKKRSCFKILGQKSFNFNNNLLLEGFLHVQISNLFGFIIISTCKKIWKGFTHVIKRHQNVLSKEVADHFYCFCIELNGSNIVFCELNL